MTNFDPKPPVTINKDLLNKSRESLGLSKPQVTGIQTKTVGLVQPKAPTIDPNSMVGVGSFSEDPDQGDKEFGQQAKEAGFTALSEAPSILGQFQNDTSTLNDRGDIRKANAGKTMSLGIIWSKNRFCFWCARNCYWCCSRNRCGSYRNCWNSKSNG